MKIKIGTRGSKLALVQANFVCDNLKKKYPEHEFEIEVIKTKGDLIQDKPLNQIGDKGLFVKEIEQKILDNEVQLGVHSMKDMPSLPAEGLVFTKAWKREDPRDVLILREKNSLWELPKNAVIGTGSKRRAFQLLKLRPDLNIVDIRGNIDTRIKKMKEQNMDGIVLAAAGLHRLGLHDYITQYFSSEEMISAPAQGILALEVRKDNSKLIEMVNSLSDEETNNIAIVEREFLNYVGGDCHVPIGAICNKDNDETYTLKAVLGNEDGSKLSFVNVTGKNLRQIAKEAALKVKKEVSGKVYLVGGGPGDVGLITVKGLEFIKSADCLVYDRLSSPELLSYTKDNCEKIYVGKANHNHTMKQDEINKLLVKKALEHDIVVRLKGGDPYVFGRGGEEALELYENGISFEVVPGISSAIAGLTYAGIPITHRGISTGFNVVTAHNKNDELADIDFDSMAKNNNTCVFLMGLSKLGEITDNLLKSGKDENTKVAVISCATTSKQKVCVGNLKDINDKVNNERLPSPALIVVGDVVGLREKLNFFENTPLFCKKILLPKIGHSNNLLAEKLRKLGAYVEEVVVGRIEYIDIKIKLEELAKIDWILFTSKHGVEGFFKCLKNSNLDVRALSRIKFAVIGSETKKYLMKYGIIADFIPNEYNSMKLGKEFSDIIKKGMTLLYPKAKNIDNNLKLDLEELCHFIEVDVYENIKADSINLDINTLDGFDNVLFTCASSAERTLYSIKSVPEKWKEKNVVISIGPKCSLAIEKLGITNYLQSDESTYESMIDKVIEVNKN